MGTPSSHTERFRLEIRRPSEPFETHGFFESIELAQQAADDDIVSPMPMSDQQIRNAVQLELEANPATAPLRVGVDVLDHRVFLDGLVHDLSEVRLVEQAAAHVPDVGEVVDLLDVEQC
jgi:osmotically-inducible protein OsmY